MQVPDDKAFCFEGYTLDLQRGSLRHGHCELELRPKSFEVLRHLVLNAGRLVSKEELIEAVWSDVNVTDESVTRCVSDVRLTLGDSEQRIIKTVLKRGYVFNAAVSRPEAPDPEAGLPAVPPPAAISIVVLPFADPSADAAENRLAEGITEGLRNYLSRLADIFVVARNTSLTFKEHAVDERQIGRQLGVRYVLDGRLQCECTRVRVSAQLVDARTGAVLWSIQFDAVRTDALDLQDNIVTRLARTIQIELAGLEAARISLGTPTRDDADGLARRGEAVFLKYGPNREETESAYELCARALEIDPHNACALSILAEKYATRVTASQSIQREDDIRCAAALVSRALASAPDSCYAHHAKARLLVAQKRPEEALVEAERALALNPSFIPTYQIVCMANIFLGRPDRIIEDAEKAMQLSPLDPFRYIFQAFKAYAHVMLGEMASAIECLRLAVANNPDFPTPIAWLAALLALAGEVDEAHETLQRYLAIPGARTRTIAQWKTSSWAGSPGYLAFRERLYEGLRRAGMPEG